MTLDEKLLMMLSELDAAARTLQECLLARDAERIWSALARQEKSMENLDALHRERPEGIEQTVRGNSLVRELLKRSRAAVQANRVLSLRFMEVVGSTLARLGGGSAPTYAGYGTPARRTAPLLVCQQG